MRPVLAIALAAVCAGPALGQSSFSSNNQPRVITGLADLDFWTELVTGGSCTAERLSAALATDRARQACDTNDGACYERAGTAVTLACVSGQDIAASCIATAGSPGTEAFEDCLAAALNTHTQPIRDFSDTMRRADAFLSNATDLIQNGLPDPIEVSGRTSLTFPERRRILNAIEDAQTVPAVDCKRQDDVDACLDEAGYQSLANVGRFSSLAHGLNR